MYIHRYIDVTHDPDLSGLISITIIDDRIVECGITSLVHEEVSPYQKIQILDTIDFGRFVQQTALNLLAKLPTNQKIMA